MHTDTAQQLLDPKLAELRTLRCTITGISGGHLIEISDVLFVPLQFYFVTLHGDKLIIMICKDKASQEL